MSLATSDQEIECPHYKATLPIELFDALKLEAELKRSSSDRVRSRECLLEFGNAINNRGQCRVSGPGSALREFQSEFGMNVAKAFAGESGDLLPTRTSYLYYEKGDFSFFHNDAPSAHITLIVGLSENLLPLVTFPAFGPASQADVDILNRIETVEYGSFQEQMKNHFGNRASTYEIPIEFGAVVAIPGSKIPHSRLKQPSEGVVCTSCYSFVQPESSWLIGHHASKN